MHKDINTYTQTNYNVVIYATRNKHWKANSLIVINVGVRGSIYTTIMKQLKDI